MARKLKKFVMTLSPSLLEAIDLARGEIERNRWLEEVLWKTREIRQAGVSREERKLGGRPRKSAG